MNLTRSKLMKIISGGQTGADRAALDAAIKYGFPHGGWIPKGRKTEIGALPSHYQLEEMKSRKYHKRTKQNVLDSDGTVIFFHENLSGGSKHTEKVATKYKKPFLLINLSEIPAFQAVINIHDWILECQISVLNVAGSRASKDPKIYSNVKFIISCILLLSLDQENPEASFKNNPPNGTNNRFSTYPKSLDEAANRIISEVPFNDKIVIANMEVEELDPICLAFEGFIRYHFGLEDNNDDLLQSCREAADQEDLDKESVSRIIMYRVWEILRGNDAYRLLR